LEIGIDAFFFERTVIHPFRRWIMGRSYSPDLRKRVVAFVKAGHSCRAAARHFNVSASCAVKLLRRVSQSGSVLPDRQGRPAGKGRLAAYEARLIGAVEAKPDITMPELAAWLEDEHGLQADPATLSRFLCRRGFSYKKSSDGVGMRSLCKQG
jgi:transposase